VSENLWAICEECNSGKKNLFETQDQDLMRRVMQYDSVHVRIGETLKAKPGQPLPSSLLEFVADQDDWKKRTRELRYLGWKVRVIKKKVNGKIRAFYQLDEWKPWPDNPTAVIRQYEQRRALRNKAKKNIAGAN
jgi:hypothetical protein